MNASYIVFAAGGKEFAMDLRDVAEVVDGPSLFPIPLAPSYFPGGINFHGDVIPVVHVAELDGAGRGLPTGPVVVLDRRAGSLGLQVDRVIDMLVGGDSPPEEGAAPAPAPQPGEGTILLSAAEIIGEVEVRLARGEM